MDPVDVAAPTAIGRYVLYGAIGRGGMATVHLGRLVGDEGFGRTVAIKRLRPHCAADPGVVLAFLDEARLATRIRHPNVVATLDVVTEAGEAFLVMDYVEGESLSALVKRSGKSGVPPPIAVAVIAGALRGLRAAHEAVSESGEPLNLVHRDVSPQNILVGVDGIPRVLDFGIAKALGRQQTTRDGELKGKLAYMAPEQLTGAGVTRQTDLFALGIVLWELLAGRRLFHADHEGETVTRALHAPIELPSTICPSAPAVLDAVVMHSLEREPSKRFASAEEMALALEAAMSPATTGVVGEWVRGVASESLEGRARQVRAVETHASRAVLPGPQQDTRTPAPRVLPRVDAGDGNPAGATVSLRRSLPLPRSRFPRIAAVAVAAVVVAGTEAVVLVRRAAPPPAPASVAVTLPIAASLPPAPSGVSAPLDPPAETELPGAGAPPLAAPPAPSKFPSPALWTSPSARPGSGPRGAGPPGKALPLYSRD